MCEQVNISVTCSCTSLSLFREIHFSGNEEVKFEFFTPQKLNYSSRVELCESLSGENMLYRCILHFRRCLQWK